MHGVEPKVTTMAIFNIKSAFIQPICKSLYLDPNNPIPPLLSLYTGLDTKTFFIIFALGWVFQVFCIWLHNFFISNIFRKFSIFDQIMHAFQSVATPFSSKDWADGEGSCEQHFERMKMVEKEVIGTIKINAVFLVLHILPLAYLGNFYLVFFSKHVHFVLY